MITEAQRRALFALREALHLCDEAEISILAENNFRDASSVVDVGMLPYFPCTVPGISDFLVEHPEQ